MARRFGFLIGAVILLQNYLNQVSGIPTPASTTTNNVSSSTSGYLKFNIDPDIINPDCTASYAVNVNIKAAASPNHETSLACDSIRAYLAQQRGRVDVDLMITCPGVPIEDHGDRGTKFILSYASDGGSAALKREVVEQKQEQGQKAADADAEAQLQADDERQIDARLTIRDDSPDGFNIAGVPVVLGVRVDSSKAQAVYQFIYCP